MSYVNFDIFYVKIVQCHLFYSHDLDLDVMAKILTLYCLDRQSSDWHLDRKTYLMLFVSMYVGYK